MQAPGEALLAKFWETIAEKGIGGLFRPWQMRREGRAAIDVRREEILMLAQAEQDAEAIRRGELSIPLSGQRLLGRDGNGCVSLKAEPFLDAGSLSQVCADIQVADEVRKQVNITRALLHAEEALETGSQDSPKESVNDDWLYRWRDSASHVSSEELQNLWGRLLAGEVRSPGHYSLRTLEFLRNLSKEEASAIELLSQFTIDGAIFREAKDILDSEGVEYGFLLSMQQLGVLAGVEAIGLNRTLTSTQSDKFIRAVCSNGMVLVASGTDATAKLTLPVYQVTEIGNQVMSLGTFQVNIPYLRKVGEHIKRQGFEVDLAKYVDVGENQIRYFDAERL